MANSYGWDVLDVVSLNKEWCIICTKQRTHEVYQEFKLCMCCLEVTQSGGATCDNQAV